MTPPPGTDGGGASQPADRRARVERLTALLVLGVLFLGLAVWSWRRSGDPLVDFGRELYTAWRLSAGDVLYRDVASLFGPLSAYFNAALFRLFGVSLTVLLAANLAIAGGTTWLVYRLLEAMADRFAALVGGIVFLTMFAFSHAPDIDTYNFVTPYSHEAMHGLVLCLALLWCLRRGEESESPIWTAAAGAALGGAFLTKPEVFVAALVAAIAWWTASTGAPRGRAGTGVFAAGAVAVPLAAWLAFLPPLGAAGAARAAAGAWLHVDDALSSSAYYGWVAGLNRPKENLLALVRISAALAAVGAMAVAADRALGSLAARRRWLRPAVMLLCAAILVLGLSRIPWLQLGRPLPLVAAAGAAWSAWSLRRGERTGASGGDRRLALAWSALSLALLVKVALHARFDHYGVYLGLPATLLAVALLLSVLPGWLHRRWGGGSVFRGVALTGIVTLVGVSLGLSFQSMVAKEVAIGDGGDRLYVGSVDEPGLGRLFDRVLEAAGETVPHGGTLAVLPEGASINYWLRRSSPTPFISLMPPELTAFGSAEVVAALRESPPDAVLLVHRSGEEYGQSQLWALPAYDPLLRWVLGRYRRVARFRGEGGEVRLELLLPRAERAGEG